MKVVLPKFLKECGEYFFREVQALTRLVFSDNGEMNDALKIVLHRFYLVVADRACACGILILICISVASKES